MPIHDVIGMRHRQFRGERPDDGRRIVPVVAAFQEGPYQEGGGKVAKGIDGEMKQDV